MTVSAKTTTCRVLPRRARRRRTRLKTVPTARPRSRRRTRGHHRALLAVSRCCLECPTPEASGRRGCPAAPPQGPRRQQAATRRQATSSPWPPLQVAVPFDRVRRPLRTPSLTTPATPSPLAPRPCSRQRTRTTTGRWGLVCRIVPTSLNRSRRHRSVCRPWPSPSQAWAWTSRPIRSPGTSQPTMTQPARGTGTPRRMRLRHPPRTSVPRLTRPLRPRRVRRRVATRRTPVARTQARSRRCRTSHGCLMRTTSASCGTTFVHGLCDAKVLSSTDFDCPPQR
mmetsp:Transcript_58486/g.165199  ORF Transcript_58486/g.165199 Transcript_58486/m.165199 type:complete len:282 (-) Transcript_58486:485-1330(-)